MIALRFVLKITLVIVIVFTVWDFYVLLQFGLFFSLFSSIVSSFQRYRQKFQEVSLEHLEHAREMHRNIFGKK